MARHGHFRDDLPSAAGGVRASPRYKAWELPPGRRRPAAGVYRRFLQRLEGMLGQKEWLAAAHDTLPAQRDALRFRKGAQRPGELCIHACCAHVLADWCACRTTSAVVVVPDA